MRAVVSGMIATYPVGGVAWDYAQYALGLEALGFEVTYVEDTGLDSYDPTTGHYGHAGYGVDFLSRCLASLSPGLAERWHYRSVHDTAHGMSLEQAETAVAEADVFVNVSGATLLRPAYLASPRKVLIDTDPGWNHFRNYPRADAQPGWRGCASWRKHDVFLTYAERLGSVGCVLPDLGIDWRPTRPPVCVDRWEATGDGQTWTTVMTWKNFTEDVRSPEGRVFGTKEVHFASIESLPSQLPEQAFEIAVGGSEPPRRRWEQLGWRTRRAEDVSRTHDAYRDYVVGSRGELSVAKDLYVATVSGWSSCRSTCYLAASRPVVLQDTGYSTVVPAGEGLLAFDDTASAADAVRRVEQDYDHHCAAARQVAAECFAAEVVLADLLDKAGV